MFHIKCRFSVILCRSEKKFFPCFCVRVELPFPECCAVIQDAECQDVGGTGRESRQQQQQRLLVEQSRRLTTADLFLQFTWTKDFYCREHLCNCVVPAFYTI